MIFFVCVTAYAIVRYQLMDIEVIIRRALVFAGLFGFVYAVFAGVAYLTQEVFAGVFGANRWLAMIPSVFIIILTLDPLRKFLVGATDRFLFQKKYDYKDLLRTFSNEVLTVLDIKKLVGLTADRLYDIIRLENVSLFIFDRDTEKFSLASSINSKYKDISFDRTHSLVEFFKLTHVYLLKNKNIDTLSSAKQLKEIIKTLDAELILPVFLHDDLMAIISLGRKKSGEEYNQDDLDILAPLAQTLAVAISNARLFDELAKTQAEAAQREKMAVIGTLAAGINHEICNPLGIARGQCETFLLNKKDGLYDNKTEKELVDEAMRIMELTIRETDRATAITKKLSTFAKPSRATELEVVHIEQELDEVLAFVGHELQLDKIQLKKIIPANLPAIRADKKQIQEVLFNLIRNAGQAMAEGGTLTIHMQATNGKLIVDIQDTGHGIPADKASQIFNPFYTTKEPGKGTGLGLFIVRQVVERNKGKISFQSKEGEGTTFTLEFPVAEQATVRV